MIRLRSILTAAFALLIPAFVHAQSVEFGNIQVVQNDAGNTSASVTVTKTAGSSPNFSIIDANRGDININFGTPNDVSGGIMISSVAQNGRTDTAGGDTTGLFYATSATDTDRNRYLLSVFSCAQGLEVNINASCAWFNYSQWLGGLVRNTTGANGGANDLFTGSSSIHLGTQFVDNGAGVSTVNLTGISGSSASGILLVSHGKNEDNYAASKANTDGTFTVWVHDNGVNGATYEQDPVAFVYIPTSAVGTKQLVAMGRVTSGATSEVGGGTYTVAKGGTGQWYLTIPGQNNTTGVLIISPEGGETNNSDNVISYQWDATNSRWVIESRDLSGATTQPTLQNGNATTEKMFSFAFFKAPVAPTSTITSPVAGTLAAPANFTVEATASDSDGTIAQVEFLRNGVVVGTDTTAPYTLAQSALPGGAYTYVARAIDNSGAAGLSVPVTVRVEYDPNNVPANTALWFDGANDYVTMGVAPELGAGGPPNKGLTLECWIRKEAGGAIADSGSGGISGIPIFGKGRGEDDGSNIDCNYFFGIDAHGHLVADFETYPATGLTTGQNYPFTASNTPILDNVWYHVAVTYDGATQTWKMYLNGALVGTTTAAAGALPRYDSIQHFGIGSAFDSHGVASGAFAGTIDEVRVWNVARTAAQILASKDQELSTGPGLIGRFGMNEGAGLTTTSSTAATVGTLTNGPAWVPGAPFTTVNTAPTVTTADASSTFPAAATLTATAADTGGSIAKVQFLVDGTVVGEDTTSPYSISWTPTAAGDYTITARAVDNLGARTTSATATAHILPNANQPPVITINSPASGAVVSGSSANLNLTLNDPNSDAMTVTFYGRYTTPVTPGPDFTIVAIPDSQFYSEGAQLHANTITTDQLAATFGAQTQWVIDNKATRNIVFVSHMGDIVQSSDNNGNDVEWIRASAAMGRLENPATALRAYGIPYGAAPGNHDLEPNGTYDAPGSVTTFNRFFGIPRFQGRDYYGGHYGVENSNNYELFSASGLDFVILHLSYDTSPNKAVLDWADSVLKAYPQRRAIVTCHSILGGGNPAPFSPQGQAVYDALKNNPNLFMTWCGHIHAEGIRTDIYQGRKVYSILQDYQGATNGGNGFLKIYTFSPAHNHIRSESYSPTLGRTINSSDNIPDWQGTIDLDYDMQSPTTDWVPLGTVSVPAGGTFASTNWTGLAAGKSFEWYAAISDGLNTVSTAATRFTTAPAAAPTISLDAPVNNSTYQTPATVNLAATAADTDGTVARVEFYVDATKIAETSTAPYTATWSGATPGTYTVSAVAVDDSGQATLSNLARVTIALGDHLPTVAVTAPADNTAYPTPANFTLTADAHDDEGPITKVQFYSGDTLLGEDTTAPFTWDMTGITTGVYTITAKATDSAGQTTTSAPIDVVVFTQPPPPSLVNLAVGTFDVPSWTVVATGASPHQFNQPGTTVGQLELKINGASVVYNNGLTLVTNWSGPGTIAAGTTSNDNISQPFADASGHAFINVLDNTNNNAPGANPTTSAQSAGVSVAYLPFSDGWTGAVVAGTGTAISSNLPTGVTVKRAGINGTYIVSGLSPEGNLFAMATGGSGSDADNILSVSQRENQWSIVTRDNAGGGQDGPFEFVYIPHELTGVYAGLVSRGGVVTSKNASLTNLGITANYTADYCDVTFGDGTIVNPTTAAFFVTADSTNGGPSNPGVASIIAWSASGNSFRIFAEDLPEVNGTFVPIDMRVLAIPYASVSGTLTRGPYLQKAAPTQMTLRWRSSKSVAGRVQFGTTQGSLSQTMDESAATADHSVTLTGLTPGTTYYYSVGTPLDTLASGPTYTFTTPPAAGTATNTRVWVLGDAGTANSNQTAVRDAFYTWTGARFPDLALQLGNNTASTGSDAEFKAGMFDIYPTLLRRTPFWSCLGNNETAQATAFVDTYPYFGIYNFPTAGESGGVPSGTEHYYSFDYGNIHFISLDSMTASRSAGGAMATWLTSDLASTSATWIVCFFHHPPYTKGSHDSDTETELTEMRQNILPILEAGGVDLVLSGHSHDYERSSLLDAHYGLSTTLTAAMKKNAGDGRPAGNGAYLKPLTGPRDHFGTVYTVAGSSGQIGGGALNHPANLISLNSLGSLVLDINGTRLDATFVKSDGSTPDTFTIIKQGAADSDGDGIPDEWEIAHGLDRHLASDAALDSDGDGLTNLQEYRAGTNPLDASDKPHVAHLTAQPDGSMTIQIPTILGRNYRLEANNQFPGGSWSLVADSVTGTGGLVDVPDPNAANTPNRIYRVTVLLP